MSLRGHPRGVARGAAPRVDGQPDEVHLDELAQLARVLEPRLVPAEVRRRSAPHGREELAARDDLVAHRRDVVLPAAGAEEAEVLRARRVAGEDLRQVALELRLRADRGRQLDRPREAVALGDLLEQLVDVVEAELREQLVDDAWRRDRHVRVGLIRDHACRQRRASLRSPCVICPRLAAPSIDREPRARGGSPRGDSPSRRRPGRHGGRAGRAPRPCPLRRR